VVISTAVLNAEASRLMRRMAEPGLTPDAAAALARRLAEVQKRLAEEKPT
jgi:hypothetical protein